MKQKNLLNRDLVAVSGDSESRYKTLINTIPAGIYTCDKEGRITFYNDVAAKLWGYSPKINEDLIRFCACFKLWAMDGSFIAPKDTPMAIAIKTGQAIRNVEALVERPDGTKFYTSVNIEPLYDEKNELNGAINVFQDITAMKETELALRESEEKYKMLIESLETSLDAEGRLNIYTDEKDAERAYRESESRYRELAALLEVKILEKTNHLQERNEQLKLSEERYHKMVEEFED